MDSGRVTFRFDDDERAVEGVKLWLEHADRSVADWNLGCDLFYLSGTVDPGPGAFSGDARFEVDLRSLDDTIARLAGKETTFYPVDDPLCMRVWRDGDRLCFELATELDWDYYPATVKPADYRRHVVRLEGSVPAT